MKLSIWPQFSSNHSSEFTLVGAFETPAKARAAAAQLNKELKSICDWLWLPENSETREMVEGRGFLPATPPEKQIAAKYGVDWEYTLLDDWLQYHNEVNPIEVYDNLVFLVSDRCWMPPHPVDQIVEELGAQVAVTGNRRLELVEMDLGDGPRLYLDESAIEDGRVEVQITCRLTDPEQTQEFLPVVQSYFEWAGRQTRQTFRMNQPSGDLERDLARSLTQGSITRDDDRLVINVQMSYVHIGLKPLIDFLKSRRCASFSYRISQSEELPY